jgi:hypothetical protein
MPKGCDEVSSADSRAYVLGRLREATGISGAWAVSRGLPWHL